jgi:hypothetical protein
MRIALTLPVVLCVSLAPAAAGQRTDAVDEGAQQPPLAAPRNTRLPIELYLDFGMAIAGNEVITLSDLRSKLATNEFQNRAKAGESFERLETDALVEIIETMMQIQAGKDRGFDPLFVDAITDNRFEELIEEKGGHSEFSTSLQNFGISPQEYKAQVKDALYRRVWRESMTGQQRGPLGRFSVDRNIRPGLLKSAYGAYASSKVARERALVGAEPERVVLQAIVLDVQRYGGLDKCMALARQLRADAASGEQDFEFLVNAWSEFKTNGGVFEPVSTGAMLRNMSLNWHGSEELSSFVQGAQPGDVSQPIVRQEPYGLFIYRLVELLPANTPTPFEDVELQRRLEAALVADLDEIRLERAMRELKAVTHVWPPDLREFLAQKR